MKNAILAVFLCFWVIGCDSKEKGTTGILEQIKAIPESSPTPIPVPEPIQNLSPYPTPIVVAPTATPTPKPSPTPQRQKPARVSGIQIVENAKKYIGTVEKPGNRGKQIDEWNRMAGVPLGSPYCGSFAGAMHLEAGSTPPKGYAYTPTWFTGPQNITWDQVKPGDVVGFYYPSKKRIAHIAIVERYSTPYTKTVEANTSYDAKAGTAADRDGDGVHAKMRNTKILTQERNKVARYWE